LTLTEYEHHTQMARDFLGSRQLVNNFVNFYIYL